MRKDIGLVRLEAILNVNVTGLCHQTVKGRIQLSRSEENRFALFYQGGTESAAPMGRCIITTSSHRSNFQPTAVKVPMCLKPKAACSPTEPALAESPIRAKICRMPIASQRSISLESRVLPTPGDAHELMSHHDKKNEL